MIYITDIYIPHFLVSDIAIFVLKRDVKLQLTNIPYFLLKYPILSVENIRFFVVFSIYVKMQQIIAVFSTKSDLITICIMSVISLKISVVLI